MCHFAESNINHGLTSMDYDNYVRLNINSTECKSAGATTHLSSAQWNENNKWNKEGAQKDTGLKKIVLVVMAVCCHIESITKLTLATVHKHKLKHKILHDATCRLQPIKTSSRHSHLAVKLNRKCKCTCLTTWKRSIPEFDSVQLFYRHS